ncbi:MAG: aldehyde dehydrogenase [Clostridia bacterium]|nr:aldehyde dehydrogenase [Clostridia bacterium]
MEKQQIHAIVENQKAYFDSGATKCVDVRIGYLKKIKEYIIKNESTIAAALKADLGKSAYESYLCEIAVVLAEVNYMLKNIRRLTKNKTVPTPFGQQLSHSYVRPTPYGTVLVMSPWNYPFMLTIPPVIDAVAAGNTCIVKTSAYSPNTSKLVKDMLESIFPQEYVSVITGGREENTYLLDEKFDYIFFTGSKNVGKLILRKAAENLTPVTLELGGKSPTIVDETASLRIAARRLVFGKGFNVGQTCVAPDYVYVHRSIKDKFLTLVKEEITRQFGDCLNNEYYGCIINDKHFERVCSLIDHSKVIHGGKSDPATRKIQMTVMDNVTWDDAVMKEEIFGPIIPVLTYDRLDDVIAEIKKRDKPLALYIFSSSKANIEKVHSSCSFGGGCINETDIHVITTAMGFGGVGESGMGQYHGKDGFDTFTHYTSIVDKKTWIDLGQRYQPYNKMNLWFSRNLNFGSTIHKTLKMDCNTLPNSFNELLGFYFRKK